jgi:adenylate cyclase
MLASGMADAVDDIREELAAGLEGDARAARLALVDDLLARGCSIAELRTAHAEDRLSLLPLDLLLRSEGHQTMGEVAAAHGVSLDDLAVTRRALGLPADLEAAIYGDPLAQQASRLRAALDAGVPVEALVEVNRVIGRSLAAIVAAGRDVIGQTLGSGTGLNEHAQATGVAAAVERLMPLMRDVLLYAYDEHSRELVRNQQAGALALAAGTADVREVAVAFADLVGFTSLGEALAPGEFSMVAGRLEKIAGDSLRPGVTLVKMIGDEVMLASPDAAALAETVLALVAAAEGSDLPPLRAGAALGHAVPRSADWYGAPVNLASRLTALAEPSTLLADAPFREAAGDAVAAWSASGEREVRGVGRPVVTYTTTAG